MQQLLSITFVAVLVFSCGAALAWSPLDDAWNARECRSTIASSEPEEQPDQPANTEDEEEPDCD